MIVDTNVWIDCFNDQSSAQAQRLARAMQDGDIRSTTDRVIAQRCLRDGQPLRAKDPDFERMAQWVALKLVI